MAQLPRLALATDSLGSDPSAASLALLAAFTGRRGRVQHFRSRARPVGRDQLSAITGLPGRHLDAWLMPPCVCRHVFARGCLQSDLAVVEGALDEATVAPGSFPYDRPGRLGPLVEALDLPVVAVLDAARLRSAHLPRLAGCVQAVVIDGLESIEEFPQLRGLVEAFLKRPVLGALEILPEVRASLRETPSDVPFPSDSVGHLAASFLTFADLPALRALAESRPFPTLDPGREFGRGRRFRVAYAHDEAFGGYFPDTLETLEAMGAELEEFSPLRSEGLPADVDLVMIGCGYPDRHAEALASNFSLIGALRSHVCQGRRIYTEGGGTAYLGRNLLLDGRSVPGAGILPFDAELRSHPRGPTPVCRTLTRDSWLGPRGTVVRGYRSGRWRLRPAPEPTDCPSRSGALTHQRDVYFRKHAVGSLIHLHLAALPDVVASFAFEPLRTDHASARP